MTFFEILFAIMGGLLIGLVFYCILRISGPWGSLWTFLLILIVSGIAAAAWIPPYGPTIYGTAWLPSFFVILLLAQLLAAATPPAGRMRYKEPKIRDSGDVAAVAVGVFFWIFLLFLVAAAVIGAITGY